MDLPMSPAMIDWIIIRLNKSLPLGVHFHGKNNGDCMHHGFHELQEAQ